MTLWRQIQTLGNITMSRINIERKTYTDSILAKDPLSLKSYLKFIQILWKRQPFLLLRPLVYETVSALHSSLARSKVFQSPSVGISFSPLSFIWQLTVSERLHDTFIFVKTTAVFQFKAKELLFYTLRSQTFRGCFIST